MTPATSTVSVGVADGVAHVVLSHPPLNILTRQVLAELREELTRLRDAPGVRVLLLLGRGPHFSAGADVREHLPPDDATLIPEFLATIGALDRFPQPVVAGVRGRCLGGGFELVQAADLVVAGETATFGQPEIALGVIAPAACVLLPASVPAATAARMLYTGDPLSAAEAERAGLVCRVVPDGEVDAAAGELAARIARHSGAALRLAKLAVREGDELRRASRLRAAGQLYLEQVMATADASEGLHAFLEKRRPVWSDR